MESNFEEELKKNMEDFLKRKYETKEIENLYINLSFIKKGTFGIVYSSIDQNRNKLKILNLLRFFKVIF